MNNEQKMDKDLSKRPLSIIANIIVELLFFFILAICLDFIITRDLTEALHFALRSVLVVFILDVIIYIQRKHVGLMRFNIFK